MTPQRWAEVDKLLDEVLARLPQERAAFLNAACSDDEELRHEVESLLSAHQNAEEKFLKLPAIELAAQHIQVQKDHSLIGQTFDHYSVLSILGIGGMGEVYLARDTRLARKVALKFLPPNCTQDAARVKRFEREARAVSALNHPNILTIYEIGEIAGKHFIASEYIEGQTLRELLMRGPMPVNGAVEVAIQIASALSAAHEAGIVHRDIKPENVMLRRDEYVKVLDFGLAKLTERQKSLGQTNDSDGDLAKTNPGALLGTVRYMSPEQAQGQELDHRSDIFSCGVVLYELITGAQPFKGNTTAGILDAIVHHREIPVTQVRPDAPAELGRIVSRMLEKDRELRYQTAGDLRAVLKRLRRELDSSPAHSLSSGSSSDASGSQSVQSSITPQPRNLKPLAIAAAILIILATVGFVAWRFWPESNREPSPWISAYTTQVTAFPGQERDPNLSPNGTVIYYARTIEEQSDIFWQRIGGSNATNLTKDSTEDDSQPACSPDGNRIVFRSERKGGGLFVMGATGESVRQVSAFGNNPAWSPDGKQIVFATEYVADPKRRGAESKLYVADVDTGENRELKIPGDAAQPKWSPSGARIAYYGKQSNSNSSIWTIPAGGGQPLQVTNDTALDWNPVWSPDGKYLYFASNRKSAASLWRVRIDEASGKALSEPEVVTSTSSETLGMDLSHDGRRIVYLTRQQKANLQSIGFDPVKKVKVGEPFWLTEGSRPSGSPNVSPDGQFVAFHTLGAAQEDIWVVRSDGTGSLANLTTDDFVDRLPRWSPKGERLAFYSNIVGRSQIWLINPDGSGKQQLTYSEQRCFYPFWSPNGKQIGYSITGLGTQIINVEQTWQQQTPVVLPSFNKDTGQWFSGWSWSPDGKLIAGSVAGWRNNEIHNEPGIFLYSMETQQYEKIINAGERPEWLNDSRHLLFIHRNKVWLADSQTKTKKPQLVISMPPYLISSAGISPDNRRIFYTATDHQADIYMLSLDK